MTSKKHAKPIDVNGIRQALSGEEGVLAAYLTGSQATGLTHPESDVDVAILLNDPEILNRNCTNLYQRIYQRLVPYTESISDRRELDLLFLQKLSLPHQFHAIHQGELIYYTDARKVIDYEEYVGNRYADLQPQMNEILGEYIHTVATT